MWSGGIASDVWSINAKWLVGVLTLLESEPSIFYALIDS